MNDGNTTNGSLGREVDDLQAYPLLTDSAARPGGAGPAGAPGTSPLGQLVDGTLREVLAWRPRGDTKGFVAALNQAFEIKEVDGHTEWKWTPRSYAIQADMGAVTGAQASIYARAKNALDQSLPLLDGLYPLRADSDSEDVESVRALVRNNLLALVNELGQVGGPVLLRVDDYFTKLLGPRTSGTPGTSGSSSDSPETVGGLLGKLRARFGMDRSNINMVGEEQNLTNFLILADHVVGLRRSWEAQRHHFNPSSSDVFLGTQLVLLSRALGVIAEGVHELASVLDSVYIGAAERQTTRVTLPDPSDMGQTINLTLGDLLSWIETVAAVEGPQLINDGGKDGVVVLRPTLAHLEHLAISLVAIASDGPRQSLPPGFFTARVQRALSSLKDNLGEAVRLSQQLNREIPRLNKVEPSSGQAGTAVRVSIVGKQLVEGSAISLQPPASLTGAQTILGEDVLWVGEHEIRVTFRLPQTQASVWNVVVITPEGAVGAPPLKFSVTNGDRPGIPPGDQTPTEPPFSLFPISKVEFINDDNRGLERAILEPDRFHNEVGLSLPDEGIDCIRISFTARTPNMDLKKVIAPQDLGDLVYLQRNGAEKPSEDIPIRVRYVKTPNTIEIRLDDESDPKRVTKNPINFAVGSYQLFIIRPLVPKVLPIRFRVVEDKE
ncbi:MAG TPA: hypothetical protein VFS21_13425 [Roseiflexaceae bacterium]|nr:hypothetical protein [Roseiflexaceae bacterium]